MQREDAQNTQDLSALRSNHSLWYRIQLLLYDICNIATDRAAESRTLATTDELYISAPYFTASEATIIKATLIKPPVLDNVPGFEEAEQVDQAIKASEKPISSSDPITIEDAIYGCLQNFFEKRRASGDARPCGPHDMAPIYLAVFGVTKHELKDDKFLSRLRRSGLPRLETGETVNGHEQKTKKGGKKKGRKG